MDCREIHPVNRGGMTQLENTAIGRIVVPEGVPEGYRLFYTTIDFDGKFTPELRALVGKEIAHCHQVHGKTVAEGGRRTAHGEPECDALWTDRTDLALAIKTADCIPITIIDPKNHVMANIHSGWRGTVQNITAATLDAAPLDPAASIAWIGPSIRVCCFEVGEEVAAQFEGRYIDRNRGAKAHVDTQAVVADVLRSRGVTNVIDTGLCTRCEGSIFHSYRRDKRGGRNLAIVAVNGPDPQDNF
jgi:YfiH family protein